MGATYGPEVDISFEPKQLRKVTTALLSLARTRGHRRKEMAARIIQSAMRAYRARREAAARAQEAWRARCDLWGATCRALGRCLGQLNESTARERHEAMRRMSSAAQPRATPLRI
mmetsp:Transcript_66456/g.182284  ORF Transcript_66456/g.182284 Transcript_66456/m.182284 type:complete len:115 (-) Transcript_66456:20-364(-)